MIQDLLPSGYGARKVLAPGRTGLPTEPTLPCNVNGPFRHTRGESFGGARSLQVLVRRCGMYTGTNGSPKV